MRRGDADGEPPTHRFLPSSHRSIGARFERLDPDFAALWRDHLDAVVSRSVIDDRTRFLVLTSQYTVTERSDALAENLRTAVAAGVDPSELLEVILQAYVYTGPWVVAGACAVFEDVIGSLGIELDASPASPPYRRVEDERDTWSPEDRADARLGPLFDRYGWEGISNGLRLRPGHHINMIDTLDALDPHFLATWLDAVYDGMYGRQVIDDRTRLLCVVGATLALGETHQSRRHMRAALRCGATPREVLEVVFHTTAFFGHPYVMPAAFDDLVQIADDEGCIGELVDAERVDDVRAIVAARVARRGGIQDDLRGV